LPDILFTLAFLRAMLAKRRFLLPLLLLLLAALPSVASNAAPYAYTYIDLADAPVIIVDWSKSDTQAVTIAGDRKLVFKNGEKGGKYMLILKQDATGSRKIVWPTSIRWPGDNQIPPVLTTTANRKDFLTFFFDGASYDALGILQNY
jgi:hypothetical protein